MLIFLIARVLLSSAQSEEVNWAPPSEVRLVGTPNLATHPRMRASAHVAAEMSWTGTASGHLDHLSTIVKMYVWPSDCGKGPTKSTCRWPKRLSGAANFSKGVLMCLPTLLPWQSSQSRQSRHQALTSLLRLCQMKRFTAMLSWDQRLWRCRRATWYCSPPRPVGPEK